MVSTGSTTYIYNLPHPQRKELCRILDQNDRWEELGGEHMRFDSMVIADIRRGRYGRHSPTEELLTLWGHQNHTVLELFVLLSRMQHYQAMIVLKPFVDIKYHRLIHEGEHNLSNLMQKLQTRNKNEPCTKDLGIPVENFDVSQKIINRPAGSAVNQARSPVACLNNVNNPNLFTRDNNESIVDQVQPSPVIGSSPASASKSPVHESAAGAITQISYQELQAATDNWNENTILGKGGFGRVFKGTWKHTLVAIKRIETKENTPESHNVQIKQSITELYCLNSYRHDNILPLYGYSLLGPHPCLVYQYMPGGCLEQRLKAKDPSKQLNWAQRLNIATGVARGLQFLHTIGDKPLIHGDIKSANILLDLNSEPRIGDFGLAREGPQSDFTHMKISRIHGTRPYLPDDFLRSKKLSVKVDTYSFGVVLFELATGCSAYCDSQPHKFLRDHVVFYEGEPGDLRDPRAGAPLQHCFGHFLVLGKECVSIRPKDRPEMLDVLVRLEAVAASPL